MKLPEPAYADINGASQYLSLSVPCLRNHVSAGSIPCFKVGGKWIFKLSELDTWVEKHRVNNTKNISTILDDIQTRFKD